ncbi:hypothetical protein [Pontibacillus yanchengensis]|uniref:Uncharacterized protein n=1 Tax=Pontibacillus yanchengensis Y32 TaxID=1385514 RepID=A0A0A2TA16_9BACI|nr:hypothetical protein [Pontibacillus yanchengensis]KGP71258.1 hypothetical protein N782_20405 [Pontibacillus yanchengensis Y32]
MEWILTVNGLMFVVLTILLLASYILPYITKKDSSHKESSSSACVTTYFYDRGQRWYAFVKNEGAGKAVNVRAVVMGSSHFDLPDQEDFELDSNEELPLGIFQDPISSIIVRWDDEEKHNKIAKGYYQQ